MQNEERPRSFYPKAISISLAAFIAISVVEAFYKKPLFDYSLEFIPRLQEDINQRQIEIWQFYSKYGYDCVAQVAVILFYVMIGQRSRATYYLLTGSALHAYIGWGKVMYSDPRPFWVGSAVQIFDCTSQYGNPSGHSIMTAGRAFQIYLDYATTVKNGKLGSWPAKVFFCLVAFSVAGSIMYSRLWLGAHSLDQVLFGFQIGVWFAFTANFIIKEPLMRWADKMLYNTNLPSKRDVAIPAIIGVCSIGGFTILSYLTYLFATARRPNDSMPIVWQENLTSKCPGYELYPNMTGMRDMGDLYAAFGGLFATLFSAYCFKGMRNYAKPELEWARAPARLVLAAVVAYPIRDWMAPMVPINMESSPFAIQFVDEAIPLFIAMFWMFGLCDPIALKLGLYKRQRISQETLNMQLIDQEQDDEFVAAKKADTSGENSSVFMQSVSTGISNNNNNNKY